MEVDSNQNDALREKFVSVLPPVVGSGDENNISMLLTSLGNICGPESCLLPCFENSSEETKTSEFTCWLISELLTIKNSPKIQASSRTLQVDIFQLIASRNTKLFPSLIKDYIRLGFDAAYILFDCTEKAHKCFSSIIDEDEVKFKPKTITLKDNEDLDNILCTIIEVLAKLGSYIILYDLATVDSTYKLFGLCLEGGSLSVKSSSLLSLSKFLDICCLPVDVEIQDYVLQLIGGCVVCVGQNEFAQSSEDKKIEENLYKVIAGLRKRLPKIVPCLLNEISLSLEQFLHCNYHFANLEECLLLELLHMCCDILKIQCSGLAHERMLSSMEEAVAQSMRLPQICKVCLKFLVMKDLNKVIPGDNICKIEKKKQTHQESEYESSIIECWLISPWWEKVLNDIKTLLEEDFNQENFDESIFYKNMTILQNYFELISDTIGHYSYNNLIILNYIPLDLLKQVLEYILSFISNINCKKKILKLYSLLNCALHILVVFKASFYNEESELLFQMWVSISSLPWLANQMNWMDLKPSNKSLFVTLSSKLSWVNCEEIKEKCIQGLALSPSSVAPNWRCFVIRAILSEANEPVMASLALYLPVLLHQLPNSSSQVILSESVGKLMNCNSSFVLKNLAICIRRLLCSVSNQAEVIGRKGGSEYFFDCLHCCVCQSMLEASTFPDNPKSQVDFTLVQRFFPLMESNLKEVVLEFVKSLAAVSSHCILSQNAFRSLLNLIVHEDQEVCETFAQQCSYILEAERKRIKFCQNKEKRVIAISTLSFFEDLSMCKVENPLQYLKNQKNILHTLHHFLRPEDQCFEEDILRIVANFIVSPEREISSAACLFVMDWCEEAKINPRELYLRNRKYIAEILSKLVGDGEIALVLNQLSDVFNWSQGREPKGWIHFLINQLQYLLPPLVVRSARVLKTNLLQELSSTLGLRLRDMLIDHFQHILAYLVFHCEEEEKKKVLAFISSITNIPIENIRKCSVQNQVNELILGLHGHKEMVLKEFLEIKGIESDPEGAVDLDDEETGRMKQISDFLAPRFLGILGFLDAKMLSSQSMKSEKEKALLSLSELLVLMGKHNVSLVARKVLASLKTALKMKDDIFLVINCEAWISFLNRLDESTLESILEEVVVLCIPLLKAKPELLAPLFKTILVDTPKFHSLLQFLPMLPSHKLLSPINEAISKSQNQLHRLTKCTIVESLESIWKSLNHESQDVRLHSLKKLKRILHRDQDLIHQLILDSERAQKTVSDIFFSLLIQCRESEDLDLLVAECLGLFGAIDPARLHPDTERKHKSSEVYEDIQSEQFIIDLVMALSRAFLSATDANTQTCASYAMQEIIRAYKIEPSVSGKSKGYSVYKQLPNNIQEILKPLQNSKYTISSANHRSSATYPFPLYGSKYSKTFNNWITNWTCSLIDLLVGEASKQIYSACKPLIRRDTSTALHLLPPLIICDLTDSESNLTPITAEILTILGESSCEFQPSAELQHLAVQTIFSCLDYVKRWSQEMKKKEITMKKSRAVFTPSFQLQYVLDFLDQIPREVLAKSSFKFQAYSRALLNLESYLQKNSDQLKDNLSFLQSIYVALDEPDGVAGVAAIRQVEPSLKEQIIQYEATGRLHDALGCYERLCIAQETHESYEGMLRCYLSLGQPQSVLNITQGLISRNCGLGLDLHEYRVEAAWRLGQWEELETLLNSLKEAERGKNLSWGVGMGRALLAARERNTESYLRAVQDLRIQQITPLSAASMERGAYQRAYPYILRLQILNEMDEMLLGLLKIPAVFTNFQDLEAGTPTTDLMQNLSQEELKERWNHRFSFLQMSHRYLEPLLDFRRTLLGFGRDWTKDDNPVLSKNLSEELKKSWLISAKVARKAGHLQQGELAFCGAGQGRNVFMERAKWHWVKGEQPQAVTVLKRGIETFFPDAENLKQISSSESYTDRLSCAQAKLLLARYSEESATLDVSTIKTYYRDVCDINRSWEDGHFNLAMYYDRILNTLEMKDKPVEWLSHIVQSFGKSLNYGCRYVYQSMPRLLSIWLDHGAKVIDMEKQKISQQILNNNKEKLNTLNTFLTQLLERLPNYMFLVALPQLISRICHSHSDVFSVLSKIIATVLSKYPQQSMWHMIAVSKSSYQTRQERCLQIFEIAKRLNGSLDKFIADSTKLADLFIELCDKHVEKEVSTLNLRSLMRSLPRLLSEPSFSKIIIPLQSQLSITLPTSHNFETSQNLRNLNDHNPFQRKDIYIQGVEDNLEIMSSLVAPKKVTLRGSDGNKYIMLCKPKDDMRKDCRLMEFNSLINLLLMKDPESRKRDLKIRTYMVVPLNEECGLIEWIPNLSGLRFILHRLYRDNGLYTSGQELKPLMCDVKDSLAHKRDIFLNKLLPRHPPIFHEWFLLTFVDAQAWLRARFSYCRTTAVISMVGYIVGLGDRHGENILFDSESGDTVHVDFNCLFNKGETFDWPEKVPFRLTRNMVTAMGPTGVEGTFRKTCEVTMRVMRNERDELMSLLKPFIYDPMVEWEKAERREGGGTRGLKGKFKGTGEICNAKAQTLVKNIEARLSGQINRKARGVNLPLSVEGQVNVLIEEATSIDNLCQMYLGWGPYM